MRDVFKNQLDARITGLSSANQFAPTDSPSRGMLQEAQKKKSVTICNPEKRILPSGIEKELLVGNMGIKLPKGSIVYKILEYKVYGEFIESTVIYYNPINDEIEREVITTYEKNDKWFGFEHHRTETYENLKENQEIKEDVKLTTTPSDVDNEESIGLNLNVAWIPHPGVAEDAMIISRSTQKRFKYKLFETKTFSYTEEMIPTNVHGNNELYKPFPHVGETVRADGIIFNLRKFSTDRILSHFNRKALQEIDEDFDEPYRVKAPTPYDLNDRLESVKVKDIRVYYKGDKHLGKLGKGLKGTYEMIEHYHNAYVKYLNSIIESVDAIIDDFPHIKISDSLHIDYVNAKLYLFNGPKKTWNREPLGIWKVDITLEYTFYPNVKSKITTMHGHKGIIVEVRDDELMPIDENGLRADVIIDPLGIPSRMNLGNPYEGYLTANTKVVAKKARELLNSNVDIEEIDEYVYGYLKLFSEEIAKTYYNASLEERLHYIKEDFRVLLTISNKRIPYIIANDIMNSKYAMSVNKFWIFDNGEKKLVKSPIGMQTNYIILLYKIGDDWLASPSTYVNMLGIPVAASKKRKSIIPVNHTPVKYSIAEGRMYPAFLGKEAMLELRDRAVNPKSQRLVAREILHSEKPMDIDRIIDRDRHPFGGDIPLLAMKRLFNTFGEDIVYEREYKDK